MLAQENVDFVDIATRPEHHLEMVTAAAQYERHVLCQKPAAPTLAALHAMLEICAQAGMLLMINENARHQPMSKHC